MASCISGLDQSPLAAWFALPGPPAKFSAFCRFSKSNCDCLIPAYPAPSLHSDCSSPMLRFDGSCSNFSHRGQFSNRKPRPRRPGAPPFQRHGRTLTRGTSTVRMNTLPRPIARRSSSSVSCARHLVELVLAFASYPWWRSSRSGSSSPPHQPELHVVDINFITG